MEIFDFSFDLGPLFGLIVLFGVAAVGFIIWMIVDAIGRPQEDFGSSGAKTGWTVGLILGLVFGFGFVGLIVAIVYFFIGRRPCTARAAGRRWSRAHATVTRVEHA